MTPENVLNTFKKKFGNGIKEAKAEKLPNILAKRTDCSRVWFSVEKKEFIGVVKFLCEKFENPHFAVCSGYDLGQTIEIIYHFSVNYDSDLSEISVSIKVKLSKKDLAIPTITGLIPGAVISEREIQEMLGVTVDGIPDPRRLFLDDEFPKGVYPWRKDKTGPDKLVRDMHEEDKSR